MPDRVPLVLSLFPGIGLLDRGFEAEGFCVVRGPDLLWGGDVRQFHPPAGRFNGVIGGPPCQCHSKLCGSWNRSVREDLVPEYVRCIIEAQPVWFLMENVTGCPAPEVPGYAVESFALNARDVGMAQNRPRLIVCGLRGPVPLGLDAHVARAPENPDWMPAVLASGWVRPGTEHEHRTGRGRDYGWTSWAQLRKALPAQGLPADFMDDTPFTMKAAFRMVGNGVPVPMARALARALKLALKEAAHA